MTDPTVEHMIVEVSGLPGNTDFDFFVIQVPTAPFGLSWYQGDIETSNFRSWPVRCGSSFRKGPRRFTASDMSPAGCRMAACPDIPARAI